MAKKTFTIFDAASSPQVGGVSVGAGDGIGAWLRVKEARTLGPNEFNVEEETLHFVITGSLNGATIKIVTANEVTSPMVYGVSLQTTDAGTMAQTSTTIGGSFIAKLPKGVVFSAEISGSGSPIPAVVMSVSGEIEAV